LDAGSNRLTLIATDAAGNSCVTNITLTNDVVGLTINDFSGAGLNSPRIPVSGSISASGYVVWVNGVQAVLDGLNWEATVPLPPGGTAVVQARAIPVSDNGGNGSGGSGGVSATYQDLGNPTSLGGITMEEQVDKPALMRMMIQYHYWATTNFSDPAVTSWGWLQEKLPYTNIGHETYQVYVKTPYTSGLCETLYVFPPCACLEEACLEGWSTNICTIDGVTTTNIRDAVIPTYPYFDEVHHVDYRYFNNALWDVEHDAVMTTVHLITGGKAIPGGMHWIDISASAFEFWPDDEEGDIDPTTLTVGTLGKLDSDWSLRVFLSDNFEYEATFRAPIKSYRYNVSIYKE